MLLLESNVQQAELHDNTQLPLSYRGNSVSRVGMHNEVVS